MGKIKIVASGKTIKWEVSSENALVNINCGVGNEVEVIVQAFLKGEKGDDGNQGLQGVQGIQGIQGVQGTQGNGVNYRVYTAKLFQGGTDAPIFQLAENTLGQPLQYYYNSVGNYSIDYGGVDNIFGAIIVPYLLPSGVRTGQSITIAQQGFGFVIETRINGTLSNNVLAGDVFEMRIYN